MAMTKKQLQHELKICDRWLLDLNDGGPIKGVRLSRNETGVNVLVDPREEGPVIEGLKASVQARRARIEAEIAALPDEPVEENKPN